MFAGKLVDSGSQVHLMICRGSCASCFTHVYIQGFQAQVSSLLFSPEERSERDSLVPLHTNSTSKSFDFRWIRKVITGIRSYLQQALLQLSSFLRLAYRIRSRCFCRLFNNVYAGDCIGWWHNHHTRQMFVFSWRSCIIGEWHYAFINVSINTEPVCLLRSLQNQAYSRS